MAPVVYCRTDECTGASFVQGDVLGTKDTMVSQSKSLICNYILEVMGDKLVNK